jgi:hypothetical protein
MGRQWPAESVTTSDQLDIMTYRVRSLGAEETPGGSKPTDNSAGGKLQYIHTMEVIEPIQFAGKQQRDNWTIGSETDPGADDPTTWQVQDGHPNFAAKSAKKCFLAAKIVITNDFEAAIMQLPGKEFLMRTKFRKNNAAFVDVADYYPLGSRPVGAVAGPPTAPQPSSARPVIKATVPAGPTVTAQTGPKIVPKAAVKTSTMACPECDWVGAKAEFATHADTHETGDED